MEPTVPDRAPNPSTLERARNRAMLRRDGETLVDWTLRRVDYLLACETEQECLRRTR